MIPIHLRHMRVPGFAALTLCLLLLAPPRAQAQADADAEAPAAAPPQASADAAAQDAVTALLIDVGRSHVVRTRWPVARVAVIDPKIADVQVVSPNQVVIMGKLIGTTDVLMWSEDDRMQQTRVNVGVDFAATRTDLARLFPDSELEVSQAGDVVVITGLLPSADKIAQLRRVMDATQIKYVDMTRIAGVQQVQIKVRVAEVSRHASRSLGVNLFHAGNTGFVSSGPGGVPANIGVPAEAVAARGLPFEFLNPTQAGSAVTLLTGFPAADLEVFIEALAENQYLRVLAEPNLIALNGEEANFLAGGEFPIPVTQAAGVGSAGSSITIEYREFGVQLRFRPTILGENRIRLNVGSEVSDITFIQGLVIQGSSIPTILTRRASTTLELSSGQTFGMAGMISRKVDARDSRIPGLGSLPILGPLFRSVRYQQGETELLVLVTASLVEPMASDVDALPLPGDLHVAPSDWELYLGGHIEGVEAARVAPPDAQWMRELGFDDLRGPGAWARHGQPPARSRPTVTQIRARHYSDEAAAPRPSEPTLPAVEQ